MLNLSEQIQPALGNGKTARESARQIQHAPACPRKRNPAGDVARQIQPLPSRSGRLLDYESSGFAASQQILPWAGNRKPARDRTHWIHPAPCPSRGGWGPGGEGGGRQGP